MDRNLFENGRVKREMLEPGVVSQLIGASTSLVQNPRSNPQDHINHAAIPVITALGKGDQKFKVDNSYLMWLKPV